MALKRLVEYCSLRSKPQSDSFVSEWSFQTKAWLHVHCTSSSLFTKHSTPHTLLLVCVCYFHLLTTGWQALWQIISESLHSLWLSVCALLPKWSKETGQQRFINGDPAQGRHGKATPERILLHCRKTSEHIFLLSFLPLETLTIQQGLIITGVGTNLPIYSCHVSLSPMGIKLIVCMF